MKLNHILLNAYRKTDWCCKESDCLCVVQQPLHSHHFSHLVKQLFSTHRVTPEQLLLLQATAFVSRVTSIIMPELPSSEEIAQCISTMSRISPCDLHTLSPKLTEAGHALFGRSIKVSLFGEEDVVSFFRQKEDYKSLLKKLERVHDEVQRAHANFVEVIDFPVNFKKRKALY